MRKLYLASRNFDEMIYLLNICNIRMSKLYIYIDMCVYIKEYVRELNKDCHDLISSIIDEVSRRSRILLFDYGEKKDRMFVRIIL